MCIMAAGPNVENDSIPGEQRQVEWISENSSTAGSSEGQTPEVENVWTGSEICERTETTKANKQTEQNKEANRNLELSE